jgi:hypothetical protein
MGLVWRERDNTSDTRQMGTTGIDSDTTCMFLTFTSLVRVCQGFFHFKGPSEPIIVHLPTNLKMTVGLSIILFLYLMGLE